ncbi:hypothetical protein NMY22_g16827 [Coprinellus aureogranulatus]|nr:hypothetical protein NMY22_g16827 [Coprinellus aureogranulatus]
MSHRWTQGDEDRARLPEGVKRVGYDTDTSQYTFLDRKGTLYKGEPGSQYGGKLSPVQDPIKQFEQERPQAFNNPDGTTDDADDDGPRFAPTTFQQFVPAHLITSPKSGPDDPDPSGSKMRRKLTLKTSPSKSSSPSEKRNSYPTKEYPTTAPPGSLRFKDAVRKSGLPKMQGVVQGLKRSLTGATKRGGVGGHGRSKSEGGSAMVDGGYAELVDLEERK